jgi:magnesium chelatase family protein
VLARIDLASALERDGVAADGEPVTSAAAAAEAVALARERQRARLRDEPVSLNSALDTAILRRHAGLDRPAEELLARARAAGLLSVPGRDRAIRVARTIADLDGRVRVGERDIGAALALRPEPALAWRRS